MESHEGMDDQIKKLFLEKLKEYSAFDHTLNALAALRYVLENVAEIRDETLRFDFQPRLAPPVGSTARDPYTPDALVMQRIGTSFILELKTSWNDTDPDQVIKYSKSPSVLAPDSKSHAFRLAPLHATCVPEHAWRAQSGRPL